LVFLRNRESVLGKTFVVFCLSMSLWSLGYFFPLDPLDREFTFLSFRLLHVPAIFIAVAHFHFICAFLEIIEKHKKIIIGGYIINFIFLLFSQSKFFIADMVPKFSVAYWGEPGVLYHLWLAIWLGFIVYSVCLLFVHYEKHTDIKRQQIKYIIIGSVITFTAGSTNFCLFYDINFPPYLNILSSFYVMTTAYAIVKHRLFNIKTGFSKILKNTTAVFVTAMAINFLHEIFHSLLKDAHHDTALHFYFNVFSVIFSVFSFLTIIRFFNSRFFYRFFGSTSVEHFEQIIADFREKNTVYTTMEEFKQNINTTFCENLFISSANIVALDSETRKQYSHLVNYYEDRANRDLLVTKEIPYLRGRHKVSDNLAQELVSLGEICIPLFRTSKSFIGFFVLGKKPFGALYSKEEIDVLEKISSHLSFALTNILYNSELQKEIATKTKALKVQNKEMQKLLDQQSDFIAASGHELRTPANVASMYMSVLEKKLEDDKTKKYFSSANVAIRKLISLIKRLLEIQHHDHDKIKLNLKETDIQEFMQEAYVDIKPIVKAKSITIHYDNKLKEKTELNIDPVQIRQVIQNLITNAIKFVPKDGTGAITIQLKTENRNIIISVFDNGCGVPEKTKEIIFDKFRSNHILDGNGIGLGLYLCKKIMELHKGKIWCEDNPEGKGAVFRVRIPQR